MAKENKKKTEECTFVIVKGEEVCKGFMLVVNEAKNDLLYNEFILSGYQHGLVV